MKGPSIDNTALIAVLSSIKPEGLSDNDWLKQAGLNHNYLNNLRKGTNPRVYHLERLARVAGLSLSEFWKMVEDGR